MIRRDDENENASEKRQNESKLTVNWWGVIIIFIASMAFVFNTLMAHSDRLTKVETQFSFIADKLGSIDNKMSAHMEKDK